MSPTSTTPPTPSNRPTPPGRTHIVRTCAESHRSQAQVLFFGAPYAALPPLMIPPGSDSEAPRQGCSVFSPGVEEGRKPRRRPRDRSVGKNPLDPARVSHYQACPWSATPYRGRIYYDDRPLPGVIGTSCLDTRAKSRRSLRGSAPSGSAGVSSLWTSTFYNEQRRLRPSDSPSSSFPIPRQTSY